MGTRTVIVEVTTTERTAPLGTVDGLFLFELLDSTSRVISFVETPIPGASFPQIPDNASYTARVTKNGTVLTQVFNVPPTTGRIQVLDTMRITLNA